MADRPDPIGKLIQKIDHDQSAQTPPADDHIRIQTCKGSADLTHITNLMQSGSTAALEGVMGCPQTKEDRIKTLQTIQEINGKNVKQGEATGKPVTELKTDQYSDWPSSWGTNLEVTAKPPGKPERTIYNETDWKDGRRVTEHHPDYFKKNEK